MYVAFVGSREYPRLDLVVDHVTGVARKYPDAIIVSGGCRGVDRAAEAAARRAGLKVISIRPRSFDASTWTADVHFFEGERLVRVEDGGEHPDWHSFRDAAFGRNEMIAALADHVMAYPCRQQNGALGGTGNTIHHAEDHLTPVHVYELANPTK